MTENIDLRTLEKINLGKDTLDKDLLKWLVENTNDNFWIIPHMAKNNIGVNQHIYFKEETDAVAFKLWWTEK